MGTYCKTLRPTLGTQLLQQGSASHQSSTSQTAPPNVPTLKLVGNISHLDHRSCVGILCDYQRKLQANTAVTVVCCCTDLMLTHVCLFLFCVCECTHATVHVWGGSEDNLWKSVRLFHHLVSHIPTKSKNKISKKWFEESLAMPPNTVVKRKGPGGRVWVTNKKLPAAGHEGRKVTEPGYSSFYMGKKEEPWEQTPTFAYRKQQTVMESRKLTWVITCGNKLAVG